MTPAERTRLLALLRANDTLADLEKALGIPYRPGRKRDWPRTAQAWGWWSGWKDRPRSHVGVPPELYGAFCRAHEEGVRLAQEAATGGKS